MTHLYRKAESKTVNDRMRIRSREIKRVRLVSRHGRKRNKWRGPFVLLYKEVSMRTGRPKVALILTGDERERLESLAHRSRSAPALARRARLILACAEGTDSKVVARRLHVTPATVCKWRGRFVR